MVQNIIPALLTKTEVNRDYLPKSLKDGKIIF